MALSALVADANDAVDPALRRQAVDLLLSLPGPARAKALPAIASRLSDPDGGVRLRLLRELTHDPSPATEPLLLKALDEGDPALRFLPAAALFDASVRGLLSREGMSAVRGHQDSDPLVSSALKAAERAWPVPSPSPLPSPSPTPTPVFRLGVHPPP